MTFLNYIRKSFSKIINNHKIPNLINHQIDSYKFFIQKKNKSFYRKNLGIQKEISKIFPIFSKNKNISLYFKNYKIIKPKNNKKKCFEKDLTYSYNIELNLKLVNINKINEIKISIGEIPLILKNASFIFNGMERVIVPQISRKFGIFYINEKKKNNLNEYIYKVKINILKGYKIIIEFDMNNNLFFRINKKKKIPLIILFKSLNISKKKIINFFYNNYKVYIKNKKIKIKFDFKNFYNYKFDYNLYNKKGKLLLKKNKKINKKKIKKIFNKNIKYFYISNKHLIKKIIANDIYINNNLLFKKYTIINKKKIKILKKNNIYKIFIFNLGEKNKNNYIFNILKKYNNYSKFESKYLIYKYLNFKGNSKKKIDFLFYNIFFKIRKKNNFIYKNSIKNKLSTKYLLNIIKKLIILKNKNKKLKDLNSLYFKKVKNLEYLFNEIFFLSMEIFYKNIIEKLNFMEFNKNYKLNKLEYLNTLSSLKDFFSVSEFSQFLDSTNPLSEITHKRRLTSLGPGGLTKKTANFESRDVHYTHYGRICPIETPEGPHIGLVNNLALYCKIDRKSRLLKSPYKKVKKSNLTNKIFYLNNFNEDKYYIAQSNILIKNKKIINNFISTRKYGNEKFVNKKKIKYIDINPNQIVSIASSLIPFLEHNDANRALMAANMQRQSVPCINSEFPFVGTGIEKNVVFDLNYIIKSKTNGIVKYIDSKYILILNENLKIEKYKLDKFKRTNQNTLINQKSIVNINDYIKKNQVIADSSCSKFGELALGKNVLIAFMTLKGYNFEDSIIISEKLLKNNKYTSIHILELKIPLKFNEFGEEIITKNIKNIKKNKISNLDKLGIIKIGKYILPGDILVSKKLPINNFLNKKNKFINTSYKNPNGVYGKVIDIKIFKNKKNENNYNEYNNIKKIIFKKKNIYSFLLFFKKKIIYKYKLFFLYKNKFFFIKMFNFIKIFFLNKKILLNIKNKIKKINKLIYNSFENFKENLLPFGISKIIKIKILTIKKLQPGDKMSGRHGNKGVVSKILPIRNVPYMNDGTYIDIILNPLGVPSRMNVGQALEVHLGLASWGLGRRINNIFKKNPKNLNKIKNFLYKIYNKPSEFKFIKNISDKNFYNLIKVLKKGIPFSTPIFESIKEKYINKMLLLAFPEKIRKKLKMSSDRKQLTLYNGKTNKSFDKKITVGYMYYLKLNHLVNDKIHSRSTGPYSLVTQQPLRGKSNIGGQRFGEMEVWALEAYGASYNLQEILTVKSDDILGRNEIYKNLVKGINNFYPNLPESFNVLLKELNGLCLDLFIK
ncbi:putative DNA-directed RNA polymerase subunit beta [Candidatus Zinderia insecticola CARI]|uniref:DNA-directed RNA polymerase subunit beta n=1 Tax=Zinderia insecticola (strain CARI) TaxID=871271 RepID=E0TIP6_ZINIC|nr:putative DNA-directed RNA polymerase subunit beta [Candidatus Zinderia insecticola CARI]